MRKNLLMLFAAAACILCFCKPPYVHAALHSRPMLIIGQQKDAIEDYIKEVSLPDGFMIYTSVQETEGLEAPADNGAGVQDGQYFVDHYPKARIQLGLYMKGALIGICAGQYDDNIRYLAKWIKGVKQTVYVRIGYEFDLPDNDYAPNDYQQAYRHVVDLLRKEKVGNVRYVWHSAVMMDHPGNFMAWYPGDEYVDWFGISFFNTAQTKTADAFAELARAHHIPLMIAESTPMGMYTQRGMNDWMERYFDFITRHNIKVVSYINSHWDIYPMFKAMRWGDARIQKDDAIKKRWLDFFM